MSNILWVDIETTGSDVNTCDLLEIGAVITDEDLNELTAFSGVIGTEPEQWDNVPKVVLDMHIDNGLMAESLSLSPTTYGTVLFDFVRWVDTYMPKGRVPLGGSGVGHFDRTWIVEHLTNGDVFGGPELASRITYWSYDIGCVRRFAKLFGMEPEDIEHITGRVYPTPNGKNHRGLDDIRMHIQEARDFQDVFLAVMVP